VHRTDRGPKRVEGRGRAEMSSRRARTVAAAIGDTSWIRGRRRARRGRRRSIRGRRRSSLNVRYDTITRTTGSLSPTRRHKYPRTTRPPPRPSSPPTRAPAPSSPPIPRRRGHRPGFVSSVVPPLLLLLGNLQPFKARGDRGRGGGFVEETYPRARCGVAADGRRRQE